MCSLLILLTLSATRAMTGQRQQEASSFVREVFPKCANISDAENMDHPSPDFVEALQGSFTLILEMTMMKKVSGRYTHSSAIVIHAVPTQMQMCFSKYPCRQGF